MSTTRETTWANGDTASTWANGFGVWHSRVPVGPSAAHIARAAIRKELTERGEIGPGPLYLKRVPTGPGEVIDAVPGTVVYREA